MNKQDRVMPKINLYDMTAQAHVRHLEEKRREYRERAADEKWLKKVKARFERALRRAMTPYLRDRQIASQETIQGLKEIVLRITQHAAHLGWLVMKESEDEG